MKTCIFLLTSFFFFNKCSKQSSVAGMWEWYDSNSWQPFYQSKGARSLRERNSNRLHPLQGGWKLCVVTCAKFVSPHVHSKMLKSSHFPVFLFFFPFFFKLPGFFQSRNLLWFHVNHQRLRPWPSIPVLRPWSSHGWTQARDTHSNWGWKRQESDESGCCCRYFIYLFFLPVSRSVSRIKDNVFV